MGFHLIVDQERIHQINSPNILEVYFDVFIKIRILFVEAQKREV